MPNVQKSKSHTADATLASVSDKESTKESTKGTRMKKSKMEKGLVEEVGNVSEGETAAVLTVSQAVKQTTGTDSGGNRVVERFSGDGDLDAFLVQFKVQETEYDNEKMMALIESRLEGEAALWFRVTVLDGTTQWPQLKLEMENHFKKKGLTKQFEFARLVVEGPNEQGIKNFMYRLRILAGAVVHDFADVRVRFRELVPLALADVIDRTSCWATLRKVVEDNCHAIDVGLRQKKVLVKKEKSVVRCHNCGGPHYKSQCKGKVTSNIKCFGCGGSHRLAECKKNGGNQKDRLGKERIPYIFYSCGEMAMNVEINGSLKRALIDTGANKSFISSYLVDDLSLVVEPKKTFVRTASEGTESLGVVSCEVSVANIFIQVEFLIMDGLPYEVIIGCDIMEKLRMVVHMEDKSVFVDGVPLNPPRRYTEDDMLKVVYEELEDKKVVVNVLKDQELCPEISEILSRNERKAKVGDPRFTHTISLVKGARPVFKRNYRIDELKKEFVVAKVREYLESGVIEESLSRWNSPVVVVKKGESFRMCLDFRAVNEVTETEVCNPPSVEEAIDSLSMSEYFTQLDLKDGYHQILLEKRSREVTAFSTPIGRFQFVRMPFGLKNAPSTFQSIMYVVLGEYIGTSVIVYMDDIVIHSKTEGEHIQDVKNVLNTLFEAGLVLNSKKCRFFQKSVSFLGFTVDGETVSINRDRFRGLDEKIEVRTVKQLQRALGFLGYFRKFIRGFSDRVSELHDVVSGKIKMSQAHEDALNQLRVDVKEAKPLCLPNMKLGFSLECNASNTGVGAVLCQEVNGEKRMIQVAGRKFNGAERNYSTIEKELLAIVFGVRKFKCYLNRPFVVFTDHQPLRWLQSLNNPQGRIARWKMFLQGFEYKVVYKPGSQNVVPDFLSRLTSLSAEDEDVLVKRVHIITGHGGRDACYQFIKNNYGQKIPKDKVLSVLKDCEVCTFYGASQKLRLGLVPMSGMFERIGVDCIGPLPKSVSGKRYIILATDYASGYVEGIGVKYKTASAVSEFLLRDVLLRHGPPRVIQMDSGKEFLNSTVKSLGERFSSRMKFSTPYHPEANGKAERTNKSILAKLAKLLTVCSSEWDKFLFVAIYCHNIAPQKFLNLSPYELVFRRRPIGGSDIPEILNFEDLFMKKVEEKQKLILKRNKGRLDPDDLIEGDIVLVRNRDQESKLDPKFVGPFVLDRRVGFGSYLVRSIENGKVYRMTRKDIVIFNDKSNFHSILEAPLCSGVESRTGGMSQLSDCVTISARTRLSK